MSTSRLAAGRSRLRTSRLLAAVLATSAVATTLVVTASAPVQQPQQPVTEAPDTGSALMAARFQGTEVEAVSMRTPTRTVFAQPDGKLQARLSLVPERVRQGDQWVPIDTTLQSNLKPKAAEVGLSFSRGGDTSLVELTKDGKTFSLFWPGSLPKPKIEGRSATYAEVLPGVDLVMAAVSNGYDQFIVVKTPQAAKALTSVKLGMKTSGLTAKADGNGAFDLLDAAGTAVFTVPASLMWDSKEQADTEAPRTDLAPVGVEVAADSLTIVPDRKLLTDPGTEFPVYIDPAPRTVNNDGWTTVYWDGSAGMSAGTHWNGANSQAEDKPWVGINPTARSGRAYATSPELRTRTYFQYNTSFLSGKDVFSARLDTSVVHAPACNWWHTHDLHLSKWDVYSGTNWDNQPGSDGLIASTSVGSVYSGCTGHKALSFANPDASKYALDKTGNSTFFIASAVEGNQDYWRKFNPNETKLIVDYNGAPNDPTELSTNPNLVACQWCGGMPYVGDSTIRLQAKLVDSDGDQVKPEWHVYDQHNTTTNKQVFWGAPIGSGGYATKDVSLTDFDGRLITWYVKAHDDRTGSLNYVQGPKQFKVDRTAPVNQPNVASTLYPEDNRWHGGTTVPGTFTFTANDADIDHFDYGWDDQMTQTAVADALGGKATVTLTPPGDGPRDLFVRSRDRAGNPGPKRTYHIYVRAGSGAIAQYPLDGNVQDTAYLGERHGTTHGNASYLPGAVGSALSLDGSGAHATAPTAVRTDASFSVSTWVKLDEAGTNWHTAVSQDGAVNYGFSLRYQGDDKRWRFVMPQSDVANPSYLFVASPAEATPGVWTHLTGVFDTATTQMRLYVNGELAGTRSIGTPWHAAGGLRIGQDKVNSTFGKYWKGAIDEVRMYDRALTDVEVRAEVRRDNVLVGHWRFEEESGVTARNAVQGGETASLSGGATFFVQREEPLNRAVRFDGTGQVRTTGPVVKTNASYTVSASVVLNNVSQPMTVLSQDGQDSSGFVLQQKDGRWVFGMTEANGSTAWNVLAQSAPGSAVENTPTHLTGVFDSGTKKATLYVNGVEAAVSGAAAKPLWDATQSFVMGRAQRSGEVDFLNGELDEVRVYSRALAADEIHEIVSLDTKPGRQWKLDGTGADTSGKNKSATLGSPVDWVSGQSNTSDPKDLAARLQGVPGSSLYAEHAVDASRSFSVGAWARLDKIGGNPTVVSQDGNTTSAFQLLATSDGHWAFAMYSNDVNGGGARHDSAVGGVVQVGIWTHLVGTYDADRDQMALHVNGVQAATKDHPNAWDQPTGAFRIGRALWNSAAANYFPGAIDDVETHSRVLFANEISDKAGRDLNLVHKWQFDEGIGTTAGDSVGGKQGTLTAGATYAPGRLGNAVKLDGTSGAVSTGATPRTDQNFTVSAWVYLPGDGCAELKCKRVAVSQDGERNSKFRLGYLEDRQHLSGNWLFEMSEDDTDVTQISVAAVSAVPSDFGTWVHLAGVYDRAAKQVLLYVNGNRMGEGRLNNPWPAAGGLQIGRGKLAGAAAERWPGSVDDVRMYTGALDNDGVFSLFKSYPGEDQPTAILPVADAGRWTMDEMTGASAADSSGRGNTVTFSGGSSWLAGRSGGAAWLDGVDDAGETAGPVIDTSRSFSVSAWVYAYTGITSNRGIIAQDGTRTSSFVLQYNGDSGRWAALMPKEDKDNPAMTLVTSSEPAPITRWTHLTTVYDAESKQLRLYVNGVLSGVQVGVIGWNSTGPFTIGRNKWNGVKGSFFPRGIDDVRVFSKALSNGEVGKLHDDTGAAGMGFWPFDDNSGKDVSWRANDLTFTGQPAYEQGVISRALKLDGTSSGTAKVVGVDTRDSFTVSAWAKLNRDDRTYTVLGQDGTRASAFVLQYRPESRRWVFGAHVQDADSSPLTYALSADPAALNDWTHLSGVYDHGAAQLRLYVDGKLSATKDNVRMWPADGALSIGRGKAVGAAVDQFAGSIDDVRVDLGMQSESRLLERASWPAPAPGQLGRFVNEQGEHYTASTDLPVRDGYRYQGTMGMPVPATHPNTRMLYACTTGNDAFTSTVDTCEGFTKIGEVGRVYTIKPTNIPTLPLYRCLSSGDHFESLADDCEGKTKEAVLGYVLAYAPLARYRVPQSPVDHWSSTNSVGPGYRYEGLLGYVVLSPEAGTQVLWSCREGFDTFTSLDSACEGKTLITGLGRTWTQPPAGALSKELLRCKQIVAGTNLFDSTSTTCENHEVQTRLGYVLMSVPAVEPTFPTA